MENLLDKKGCKFSATIDNIGEQTYGTGTIQVENGMVYLCQDYAVGMQCEDKLGYKYSWQVGTGSYDDLENNTVSDFRLIENGLPEYKAGDWVVMIQDYVNLKVGEVYQLIEKQGLGSSCWIVNHCEHPYLAPFERNFRLAEPHEIPAQIDSALIEESQPESKFNVGDVVNINDQGYQYTNMGVLSKNPIYTWDAIVRRCNIKSCKRSKVVIKDQAYSKIQNKWWYKFDEIGNWISECGVESSSPVAINPMDAILEEAIRKYPIGTKYKPLSPNGSEYSIEYLIEYKPRIHCSDSIEGGMGYLYIDGKWAEIVAPSVTSSITATTSGVSLTPIVPNFSGGYIGDLTATSSSPYLYSSGTGIGIGTIGHSSPLTFDLGTASIYNSQFIQEMLNFDKNTTEQKDSLHRESTIKIMQL
jgi:hypothetical protein